jgi:hypothetical protein
MWHGGRSSSGKRSCTCTAGGCHSPHARRPGNRARRLSAEAPHLHPFCRRRFPLPHSEHRTLREVSEAHDSGLAVVVCWTRFGRTLQSSPCVLGCNKHKKAHHQKGEISTLTSTAARLPQTPHSPEEAKNDELLHSSHEGSRTSGLRTGLSKTWGWLVMGPRGCLPLTGDGRQWDHDCLSAPKPSQRRQALARVPMTDLYSINNQDYQ